MERVIAVDLAERRKAYRKPDGSVLTQSELGEMLGGLTNVHISRLERGAANMTLPLALECVRIFGGLTIQYRGKRYLLTPEGFGPAPDDGEHAVTRDLDVGSAAIEQATESQEAISAIHRLPAVLRLYRANPETGRQALVDLARDAICDPVTAAKAFEAALREQLPDAGEVLAEAWALTRAEGYRRGGERLVA